MSKLSELRKSIRTLHLSDERGVLKMLSKDHAMSKVSRAAASKKAIELIEAIREDGNPGLMESFLAEYGLSTDEGVALMCLAEALLRVPDEQTIDELIEDKIVSSSWAEHLGQSDSMLVNASTWALMLTGKLLQEPSSDSIVNTLHDTVRRLGEPVVRTAVKQAMKQMGHQFILGRDMKEAINNATTLERKGYTYSYDMLGEAALTTKDADEFFKDYKHAIECLDKIADDTEILKNPGISIKLSALHPRYEVEQKERVMDELVPRIRELALLAKESGIGLNIDAEEADRLDLSLDVIEAVLRDETFTGWDGFGVVVQAYGKRASAIIDWLHELASELDRKIMVRLVKGAYWDTEIKQAQVVGLADFPVFTKKVATDISYLCCAKKLLGYSDRIYPQFATHNAHTVSSILEMADDKQAFEFQKLHGMGDALHELVRAGEGVNCRIYAPVGVHRDLLAYLVRRLLENGANSSFVNQVVDEDVPPELIADDPFLLLEGDENLENELVVKPDTLYQPERINSKGWDLRNYDEVENFTQVRNKFIDKQWIVKPVIAGEVWSEKPLPVFSPGNTDDCVGFVAQTSEDQAEMALKNARSWSESTAETRHAVLNKAADLYEENAAEIFAALCREAGKTSHDAIAEIREAVDFLRFYAAEAKRTEAQEERGIISCISPWNFPLAIFTGQISAALAAGNGVIAKPADPTPIVASIGVRLLHKAGVPKPALQLVPGSGSVIGAKITSDPRVNGVCFTGSTTVAQIINNNASKHQKPDSMFVAETGGLNAMIVDSTALPEQAIKDVVDSAFRSCGQRCSALRVLYLQEDIADQFLEMLYGAMDELEISDPWNMSSDVGPIITERARNDIQSYIDAARENGQVLKQLHVPDDGYYLGLAVIKVDGIQSLEREIFGPVLHIATFKADGIDTIIHDINASGYGLTFGLHTRIDSRVDHITGALNVGNIYVNRNQIGAIVGSQPFGGEGLSGTGPKAGGPHYVPRFKQFNLPHHTTKQADVADLEKVQQALNAVQMTNRSTLENQNMPGPTGEANIWSTHPRGTILCLGPTKKDAEKQMKIAKQMGCDAVTVAPEIKGEGVIAGLLPRQALAILSGFSAVVLWSDMEDLKKARIALSERQGAIIPLISTDEMKDFCVLERHLCIDTTAAGGNASLLAAQ